MPSITGTKCRAETGYHQIAIRDVDGSPKTTALLMPFRGGDNPRASAARRHNFDWLVRMGIMSPGDSTWDGIEKAAFHTLAALVYKTETEAELSIITDFITFLFVFDDMVDCAHSRLGTDAELVAHVGEMLMMGVLGHQAFAGAADELQLSACHRRKLVGLQNALADITRRLLDITGDRAALDHYIESMTDYFDGNVRESELRQTAENQDVTEYAALRLSVSAVYPCLEIGAILRGVNVPAEVRASHAFKEMRKACNLNVSYVNDLFSYRKESLAGETSNLVYVLKSARALSTKTALDSAAHISNMVVEGYLDIACSRTWDEGTRAYLVLMQSWMRGNMDWYIEVKDRYDAVSSTDLGLPFGVPEYSRAERALDA